MLLHIIHPYTYLLHPLAPRDRGAAELYSAFRENGRTTLQSWHVPKNSPEHIRMHQELARHPLLHTFLTARYTTYTPGTGRPLTRTPDLTTEAWQRLSAQYTPLEDCLTITRHHAEHVLIGGYFDHCVTDLALFLHEQHPKATVFVVPELSPKQPNRHPHTRARLLANKIAPITLTDALHLAS